MSKKPKIFSELEKIAPILPAPLYWTDTNVVGLGCNSLAFTVIGIPEAAREQIIGKTPYDYAPKEIADVIVKNIKQVMREKKTMLFEEPLQDRTTGKTKYLLMARAPLFDDNGIDVVGMVVSVTDITDRKEKERLEKEAEKQSAKLQEQENFRKIADQVVHDIRSPLASLLMVIKSCEKDIPELVRVTLREAAIGISDIANSLLSRYKNDDIQANTKTEEQEPVMVSLVLSQILTDKKYQYSNLPFTFEAEFGHDSNFGFIKIEPTSFKRMISNLLNNSVDAFDNNEGTVTLKLTVDKTKIQIVIQDNGKGIPQKIVDKIVNGITVTANKEGGHGLGMTQVLDTLQRNNGQISIASKVGKGTTIILTFPRVKPPEWFAEKIQLKKSDTIVILDDDESIHSAWEVRFKDYATKIYIEHFSEAIDAINFINAAASKDKIFLLADFELLKQDLTGLHVIERTGIKRSILVTSHYANQIVRELAAKSGTKILPKQLASEVPIKFANDFTQVETTNESKKVDLIIIDDNEMFANSLASLFSDKLVDVYYNPERFLENLSRYDKDTLIFTDNDLSSQTTGIGLAKQLHEAGYSRLYLLSGKDFEKSEVPNYLIAISKVDIDGIKKIIWDL